MCSHVKTQTKRRETRLINTFSSKHVLEHTVLSWREVEPSIDTSFSGYITNTPLPQGARGYNRHSEGLAEESQCLVANASNFALTPPQRGSERFSSPRGRTQLCLHSKLQMRGGGSSRKGGAPC